MAAPRARTADLLGNVAVNLKATGPAAVLIALIGGITLLGLYGHGTLAGAALGVLAFTVAALGLVLAQRT